MRDGWGGVVYCDVHLRGHLAAIELQSLYTGWENFERVLR